MESQQSLGGKKDIIQFYDFIYILLHILKNSFVNSHITCSGDHCRAMNYM